MGQQKAVQNRTPEATTQVNFSPAGSAQVVGAGPGHPLLHLQRTAGNRAVNRLIQAKLKIGRPGDRYEQEADRAADQVMRSTGPVGPTLTVTSPGVQRQCAACASGQGKCAKCAEEEVQRKPLTPAITPLIQRQDDETLEEEKEEEAETLQAKATSDRMLTLSSRTQSRINGLRGGGEPLATTTRTFFEARFGRNFSQVRTHTGAEAAETARAVKARAFTVGQDVVFGGGEYAPETNEGRRLLAHELTHVVQQTSGPASTATSVQRQPASSPPPPEPTPEEATAPALIVEDEAAELGPGQMRKSEFLSQLRTAVCAAAETALAGTDQTTEGCPYLDRWFGYYQDKDSQHIERAVRRYAPEARRATAAREYIPLVAERVRQGVERWAETGDLSGVPAELRAALSGGGLLGALGGAASGLLGGVGRGLASLGSVLFKARAGGPKVGGTPQAIQTQLGEGRPLEGGVRSRMETAFGTNFGHVRLHTDAGAAQLSDTLNARAFSVGEHIAFGSEEYQPGTLIGDALIAHELAHVMQQYGATSPAAPLPRQDFGDRALEEDADVSAGGVMARLWSTGGRKLTAVSNHVIPRLRTGLSLHRCATSGPRRTTAAPASHRAWTPERLMEILFSRGDQHVVETIINERYTIISFETAYDRWEYDDGRIEEVELPNLRGNTCRVVRRIGCPRPKEIRIRSSLSNEEAAATLFHEVGHVTRGEGLEQEIAIRIATEEFRIRHGMPEFAPGYRNPDGTVNEEFIRNQILSSPHYNPTGRTRIGRRYEGQEEVTGWHLPP